MKKKTGGRFDDSLMAIYSTFRSNTGVDEIMGKDAIINSSLSTDHQ